MKTKDEFIPYRLSIYKLCDKTDKLHCFNQIRNRILRLIDEDESLGDYVKLDVNDLKDIYLDDDGMLIFSEILIGHFEEKFIKDLWMCMRNLNKFIKNDYEFQHMFDNFSIPDLLKVIREAENYNPEDEKERASKDLVIEKAQTELKNRNIIDWGIATGKAVIKRYCNEANDAKD